jgi:uncharacterized protein YbaR (Trm112 family)
VLLSLVDSLRCPADHDESSLVLSAEAWSGTRVMGGVLGCPVCHARYPIENGVVDFSGGQQPSPSLGRDENQIDAMRLAAQLGLSEPGGLVLLTGRYASAVTGLLDLVYVTCIVIDASTDDVNAGVTFRILERLPLVDSALRAAAVDQPRAGAVFLADVARCVRPRGRVVAPAGSARPHAVQILAHDAREWVGEVHSSEQLTPLRRVTR